MVFEKTLQRRGKKHLVCLRNINIKKLIMKFIPFFIPAALISLSTVSCSKGKIFGIKGKGNNVTQTRSVSNFDEIELSIDADVYYVQDSFYSVEISAQQNVLSQLETKVEDGELEIEFDKRVFSHSKITITIHAPNIKELEVNGSGKIVAEHTVNASSMKLKISGSGNINLASLNTSNVESEINGSGNIKVSGGIIDTEDLEISGSGDIDISGATAKSASAHISGSGNIILHATDYLDATISGSGDIKYYGNPVMNVNISGSGKIIHL